MESASVLSTDDALSSDSDVTLHGAVTLRRQAPVDHVSFNELPSASAAACDNSPCEADGSASRLSYSAATEAPLSSCYQLSMRRDVMRKLEMRESVITSYSSECTRRRRVESLPCFSVASVNSEKLRAATRSSDENSATLLKVQTQHIGDKCNNIMTTPRSLPVTPEKVRTPR